MVRLYKVAINTLYICKNFLNYGAWPKQRHYIVNWSWLPMKYSINSVLLFLLLAGCMTSPDTGATPSTNSKTNFTLVSGGTGGTINYCRPKSIMRSVEAVEIYIGGDLNKLNGKLSAKIKNGSSGSIPIDLNNQFSFGLKPSMIFMRYSDQIAFSESASSKKDRYYIVKGKPNYGQGLSVLKAGGIGAYELDKTQDTGKANWDVSSVPKTEFLSLCK